MNEATPQTGAIRTGALTPGDMLGKYRIERQIGSGGTAIVWKAIDPLLNRHFAIKQFLPDQLGSNRDELQHRFRNEAAVLKRVSSTDARLTQLFDFIDEPRGLFLVMEYVDGASLDQTLAATGQPMNQREALGIVGAAAMALRIIHQAGIVHRDLKPANVLLPKAGGLKLCDFGLATVLGDQDQLETGTVRYMAPELLQEGPADPRSDIYSLGLMAYEMLAGRVAFEDAFKVVLRDQRNQALRWMKWHSNPRARAPKLSQLNPDVSETLSELIARMMEKDPSLRVSSADELLDAIRRHFQAGNAQGASPAATDRPAPPLPATKTDDDAPTAALPKRSKLPYILAANLFVLLTMAAVLFGVHNSRQQAVDNVVTDRLTKQAAEARAARTSGQFAEATTLYAALAEDPDAGPNLRRGAMAGMAMSQGQQALADDRPAAAVEAFSRADEVGLDNADFLAELDRLLREANNRKAFGDVLREIQTLIDSRRFGEADQRIQRTKQLQLRESEQKQLTEIGSTIEDQIQQARIAEIIEDAEMLVAAGKATDAITLLESELDRYRSPRIQTLLGDLTHSTRLAAFMAAASEAESAGDLAASIRALDQARNIQADPELDRRINRLQARLLYERGQAREEAGDTEGAKDLYRQSQAAMPNDQAGTALNRLASSQEKADYVAAGDTAMSTRQYEAAIANYQAALKFGADTQIEQQLVSAQVRQQVDLATQLAGQDQLARAEDALAEAMRLNPDDREGQRLRERLSLSRRYAEYLAAGDESRESSRFGDALLSYRRAQDVKDTPEVQKRLLDTEYEDLLAKAAFYIKSEKYKVASAMLETAARRAGRSDRLDKMRVIVQEKLEEEGG